MLAGLDVACEEEISNTTCKRPIFTNRWNESRVFRYNFLHFASYWGTKPLNLATKRYSYIGRLPPQPTGGKFRARRQRIYGCNPRFIARFRRAAVVLCGAFSTTINSKNGRRRWIFRANLREV